MTFTRDSFGSVGGWGGHCGVLVAGREAGATEFFLTRTSVQGNGLGGQVVREWWCWGQESGQSVLIIDFRTSVWEFNRCPGQLDLSVSCPD